MPPSMQALQERLKKRGTDSPEVIKKRLEKAEYEISFAPQFDVIIQNDDYDRAKNETLEIISKFIEQ
jgi:guanylate kinase